MIKWVKATAIVLGFLALCAATTHVILRYGITPYFCAAVVLFSLFCVIYAVRELLE